MSDQAWDLDYSGTTTKDADLNSGRPPDGWYRFTLVNVDDDNESGAKFLHFKVCHGPLAGMIHKERLNNPRFSTTAGGIEFAKKKANCYASRLGLVGTDADGKTVQAAFSGAIGKEIVGKLSTRKGDKGDFQGIDMDLYTAGHPKLGADVYPLVGLTAPAHAPKGGAAAGKHDEAPKAPATNTAEVNAAAAKALQW